MQKIHKALAVIAAVIMTAMPVQAGIRISPVQNVGQKTDQTVQITNFNEIIRYINTYFKSFYTIPQIAKNQPKTTISTIQPTTLRQITEEPTETTTTTIPTTRIKAQPTTIRTTFTTTTKTPIYSKTPNVYNGEEITSKPATTTNTADFSVQQQILNIVNKERAAYGLKPLVLDANLSKVAQAKAEDMYKNKYFSHTSPTYGSPFEMMKRFGIAYRTAGENIAKGQKTAQTVMIAWMNSEGHRKNILNGNFTKLGVGYVYNNGSPYWVQQFTG